MIGYFYVDEFHHEKILKNIYLSSVRSVFFTMLV